MRQLPSDVRDVVVSRLITVRYIKARRIAPSASLLNTSWHAKRPQCPSSGQVVVLNICNRVIAFTVGDRLDDASCRLTDHFSLRMTFLRLGDALWLSAWCSVPCPPLRDDQGSQVLRTTKLSTGQRRLTLDFATQTPSPAVSCQREP